jgi:hypothetical protein
MATISDKRLRMGPWSQPRTDKDKKNLSEQ